MHINTERLTLSSTVEGDVENIHELHSIVEVASFNTIGIPRHLSETKELLRQALAEQNEQKQKYFAWTIKETATESFVGEIGMIESIKSVIKFGFEELKLHRIEAGVAVHNTKSIALLEKIGLKREGLKRKVLPINGKWVDNYHYAILDVDEREY